MSRELNWGSTEALESVVHTAHSLTMDVQIPAHVVDRDLFIGLREFAYFNLGHNHVSLVYTSIEQGVRYAMFDAIGMMGWTSWLINPRLVPVRIWCDLKRLLIVGDTAERHMLVGQRRWWIEMGRGTVVVRTEAYERARGVLNRVGAWMLGRDKQEQVWREYMENIADHARREYSAGCSINASFPEDVEGNPWSPEEPYPGCPAWPVPGIELALLWMELETVVDHSPLLTRGALAATALCLVLFYMYAWDTPARRRRIARMMLSLGQSYVRAVRKEDQSGNDLEAQLFRYSHSKDRFTSCAAIYVLGVAAREEVITDRVTRVMGDSLLSGDPFVRHAGAAALYRLGWRAASARNALEAVAEKHRTEGASVLARETLRHIAETGRQR